jgi:hypothetical protein
LELKQDILLVFNELDGAMCYPVMVNFMERIIACWASREGHMPDIVFHCLTLTSPEDNDIFIIFLKINKFNL